MSAHPPPHCAGYRCPAHSPKASQDPMGRKPPSCRGLSWEHASPSRWRGKGGAGVRAGAPPRVCVGGRPTKRPQLITVISPPLATTESLQGFRSIFVYLALSALLPVGTVSDSEKRSNVVSHNFKVSSRVNNKLAGAAGRTRWGAPVRMEGGPSRNCFCGSGGGIEALGTEDRRTHTHTEREGGQRERE